MLSKITLNGKTGKPAIAAPWIRALNDPCIVVEKAGFLFKAATTSDRLILAVVPCLINGERSYHYNMPLENEDAFTLTGSINAQGVFTILIKPESLDLSPEQKEKYLNLYTKFGAFLISAGYKGEGILDSVTQCILQTIESSPIPKTLAEL